jgi:hypothetical protein
VFAILQVYGPHDNQQLVLRLTTNHLHIAGSLEHAVSNPVLENVDIVTTEEQLGHRVLGVDVLYALLLEVVIVGVVGEEFVGGQVVVMIGLNTRWFRIAHILLNNIFYYK